MQPTPSALDTPVPTDPTIYRFYGVLQVYGPTIKELIHEEFGDGILTSPRPEVKDEDSGDHPPGFLFHRRPPAREGSRTGLTPAPQASTASPAALMLTAALMSRSCRVPQCAHSHSRTPSLSGGR